MAHSQETRGEPIEGICRLAAQRLRPEGQTLVIARETLKSGGRG